MNSKKMISVILSICIIFTTFFVPVYADDLITQETIPQETIPQEIQIIHNIAEKYAQSEVNADGNMHWFIADFASYNQLYSESIYKLSDSEKQKCVDKIIDEVCVSDDCSYISKSIIALRALGYDAKDVTTSDFQKIDVVKKLTDLIDAQSSALENVYALPWVIVALQQDENYANEAQFNYVLNKAIELKEEWQNTDWGTDGATYMIFALSPYYNTNDEIKSAIDETIPIINEFQGDDGLICTNFYGELTPSPESTSLTIAAYSAIGIDSSLIVKNGKSLIDGLLSCATDEFDGFNPTTNSFATEQGFRGLIAYQLYKTNSGKRLYDFSQNPLNPAYATWAQHCPVIFNVTPQNATVEVEGQEQINTNKYDLPAGTYNYTVTKSRYKTKKASFTVSEEDVLNHLKKEIDISLQRKQTGHADTTIRVNVKVMIHNEDECENLYTYKKNSSEYETIANETYHVNKGESVLDLLIQALNDNNIDYDEDDGYVSEIDNISAFDHGLNSGWMFTVNGNHKNTGANETYIKSNSTIIWFYTDDYTKERGSEAFSSGSISTSVKNYQIDFKSDNKIIQSQDVEKNTLLKEPEIPKKDGFIFEGWFKDNEFKEKYDFSKKVTSSFALYAKWTEEIKAPFTDILNHKNEEAIKNLYHIGVINGKSETVFDPESTMTRAEYATIVVKALKLDSDNDSNFSDVLKTDWFYKYVSTAQFYLIIKGESELVFNPHGLITKEQAVTMIERAAKLCGINTKTEDAYAQIILPQFEDYKQISDWAYDAFAYCFKDEIISDEIISINPKEFVTRAEVAQMVYNLIKKAKNLEE